MPVKPSKEEEEYFARREIKKRLQEQEKQAKAMVDKEKERLKELHFMHCPKCGTKLDEELLEGVTVDICPGCHGVWLDEGELVKLTESKMGLFASIRGFFS